MFDKILLAVDGSEHAARATAAAAELARKHHAALWVVTVCTPLPGTYAAGLGADSLARLENFQQEQAQGLLEETRVNLGEVATHAQTEILHGTPAEAILQAAEKYQMASEIASLHKHLDERYGFSNIIGKSDSMRKVFERGDYRNR